MFSALLGVIIVLCLGGCAIEAIEERDIPWVMLGWVAAFLIFFGIVSPN